MIIHYNCTIGSFLLHSFLLIYHPYPPSFHEMIFTLVYICTCMHNCFTTTIIVLLLAISSQLLSEILCVNYIHIGELFNGADLLPQLSNCTDTEDLADPLINVWVRSIIIGTLISIKTVYVSGTIRMHPH